MRDGSSAPLRVIVYVFACPLLPGDEDLALEAELDEIFAHEGLTLVSRVVDRGPAKARRNQYPVLARMARGDADALLVVRSPLYERGAVVDRLEAAGAPGPYVWLSADDLQKAGLLPRARPPALGLPRSRATGTPTEPSRSPR